ncbi:MAG: hypothetical protein NC344_08215 [Bacteroidales bacterium]|nr:hypothetical protein [Bacteroidales bacterium]MCM1147797.1 hypothetical protein [Bacteroidales bacterium]MCM1206445.1 hypothetical protein [Bacillota bacterium]MCM1510330.1 hypothetical protein [Clostridium sp.]
MRISVFIFLALCAFLSSCQESIEQRAEREAREYTQKYCPTPPQNDVITDSIVYHSATRTYSTYMTFTGKLDDAGIMAEHESEISENMLRMVRSNSGILPYKKAGFSFEYVCRSQREPEKMLLHVTFTEKDYNSGSGKQDPQTSH